MYNESRPLRLLSDITEIATDNRIRVQGRSNMTLLPDFFLIDIYNISNTDLSIIMDSKKLYAYIGLSCVCSGEIEDVYQHTEGSNVITTVSISDGMSFWGSEISKSISGGAYMEDALRTIIEGVAFGAFVCQDYRLPRGQVFSGRCANIVASIAKSLTARAYVSNGVLNVVGEHQVINVVTVYDNEVVMPPSVSRNVCILKVDAKAFSVGDVVEYGGSRYRLIVQSINLDNFTGDWNTELTLINESEFSGDGIGGGW